MDFKKAFTFVFDDPDWFDKLIVPILVSLIPVVGSITLMGYVMRLIDNVAKGVPQPLPRFEFGEDLGRGFKLFLVQLVWMIPVFILAMLIAIPGFMFQNENGSAGAWVLTAIIIGLMVLYSLLMALLQPVITANVAIKDRFSAGFEFRELFGRLTKNIGAWLMVFAGILVGGFIAPLGAIVVVIGVILTSAYVQLMVAHLTGQAYTISDIKQ